MQRPRDVDLGEGYEALVTDTVGFIRKLPHHLVASFRATLEEAGEADLLLHTIDVSHPSWEEQKEVVEEVLSDLGMRENPTVLVFNKVDRLTHDEEEAWRERAAATAALPKRFPDAANAAFIPRRALDVCIRARTASNSWLSVSSTTLMPAATSFGSTPGLRLGGDCTLTSGSRISRAAATVHTFECRVIDSLMSRSSFKIGGPFVSQPPVPFRN